MVADGRGRIWVSLDQGISVADPRVTAINAIPVAVRMESISAGGNPVNTRNPAPIPAGIESIVFQFAGSNLAVPDRVRFRYRLDGPNPDPNADLGSHRVWSDIVATRQVSYRNLGPGSYRFVIVASNSEGLWNGPETVVPFLIEPAFWQTWWFRAIALVALGLGVFGAFRLRMYQLTQQLDMRFQERLAERSRIAQDLHDTLLQGVLSASLQLDVAEDQLPKDSPARPQLQRVLQLMARVIEEGRNALRGLRSTETESRSLELAFSRMRQEFALEERIGYRVIVDSTTRPLRPLIRDEVYRIGREALVNAFVHAHATSIEVQLDYASRHLKVTVRDDGLGIDPQVLHAGREGHWGLPGMRERSESIGASLKLRSRLGAGTEVELTVPSTIAFEDESQRPFARWLPWLRKENGNSGATDTKK
jgi:signal transduction histidine kinase